MKLSVLLQGIAPVEECDDVEVAGIATDSRKVKKGDLLYQIDPAPFNAAVMQANANMASAYATFKAAESNYKRSVPLARINAISQNRNEDPDDYFLRKLAIARELTHNQRVVLVIDNYEAIKGQTGLKELLALNWKILLITRNAFEKEHFPVLHIES